MKTPEDSDDDRRFDEQLGHVLRPSLPADANQKIRARLDQMPAPKTVPGWMNETSAIAPAPAANSWRARFIAAAIVILCATAAFIYSKSQPQESARPVPKKNPEPVDAPQTPKQDPSIVQKENPADGTRPAVLGPDKKSPLFPPKWREETPASTDSEALNAAVDQLKAAFAKHDYKRAEELAQQVEAMIKDAKRLEVKQP